MSERITLDKLKKNLSLFHKMYDSLRLVDPVDKKVLECGGSTVGETGRLCYNYWKNGRICDNCISVRAYHENKSFIKLERHSDLIMMVMALPVEETKRPVVLELLKDATDSIVVGSGEYHDELLMRNVISEINDKVIRDPLTSLYNRRFITERLPVDIVSAVIKKQPLSVIFMDIDNLKEVNDTFGHVAGDSALQKIAAAIRDCIEDDNSWAARYGGDEFLICLNNTGGGEAYRIAERVRGSIEKMPVFEQNQSVCLTASLGIYTMLGSRLTAEEIIKLADRKMYEAKNSGKNRTAG